MEIGREVAISYTISEDVALACMTVDDAGYQPSSSRPGTRLWFTSRRSWGRAGRFLAAKRRSTLRTTAHQRALFRQVSSGMSRWRARATQSTDQMVGNTGPIATFTLAVPGPAHGVSNVMSDSGICGSSGLSGQASSAAERYGYEWCPLLAPARGRNMMLAALADVTTGSATRPSHTCRRWSASR